MFRISLLIPFAIGFFAFAEGRPGRGDDGAEAVKEKLFQAKKNYDAETQKFKKSLEDLLDKREDAARKAGNKKSVDQIKAEREAFEKQGELPSITPATIRDPMNAARINLDKAYMEAAKEYIRLKLDDEAELVEKERQEVFLQSTIMFGKRTYLATFEHFDVKVWGNQFSNTGTVGTDTRTIQYKGVPASHSIFIHPLERGISQVSYTLGGKSSVFTADVGIPKTERMNGNPPSPLTFEVVADGKPIWKSEPVTKVNNFQTCTVSVEKVKTLTLRVHCPGKIDEAWTFWLEPFVVE